MRPKAEGILESSLYVNDVARSDQFYEKIFDFRVMSDFAGRGCAWRLETVKCCWLFKNSGSRAMHSPHDGELHLAFAIRAAELAGWEAWLMDNGVVVEEKCTWELGAKASISATQTGI